MAERIVDARWLEPPEPFELAVASVETLGPHERLRLLIHREPYPLYALLREWGYGHETHASDDGTYEVLIWRERQDTRKHASP